MLILYTQHDKVHKLCKHAILLTFSSLWYIWDTEKVQSAFYWILRSEVAERGGGAERESALAKPMATTAVGATPQAPAPVKKELPAKMDAESASEDPLRVDILMPSTAVHKASGSKGGQGSDGGTGEGGHGGDGPGPIAAGAATSHGGGNITRAGPVNSANVGGGDASRSTPRGGAPKRNDDGNRRTDSSLELSASSKHTAGDNPHDDLYGLEPQEWADMDLPHVSHRDKKALLQLLSPFMGVADQASGEAVTLPPQFENMSYKDIVESLSEAASAGMVAMNGGMDQDVESSNRNFNIVMSLLRTGLQGESTSDRLQAVKAIRALLSTEHENIGMSIIDQGLLPDMVKFLDSDEESLQLEALSALTSSLVVRQSDHTHFLIGSGLVPVLVKLLRSRSEDILEKAVWVLGNIAGDSPVTRDAVLAGGALLPMINIIEKCSAPRSSKTEFNPDNSAENKKRVKEESDRKGKDSGEAGGDYGKLPAGESGVSSSKKMRLLRVSVWCVSNLCDGPSMLPSFPAKSVISAMIKALSAGTDAEIISHTCWALSHLCDGPSPHVQAVVEANVCKSLTALLTHRSWRVVKPALRTIGNIVCAEDDVDYTQHIVDHNTVPCLRKLIEHSNKEIQKEACWTFSNIAAGTVSQIQCVLDSGAIAPLVALASSASTNPDVKIEACWVLLNATSCGSEQQIEYLVQHGCVSVLCDLLSHQNMLVMAVEGLEKLLQVGDDVACRAAHVSATTDPKCGPNTHAALMDLEKLNECISQNNDPLTNTVSKRVTKILQKYFVGCAICNKRYPARTVSTKFCPECKCTVCTNCNCEVYHLSYQLKEWSDIDTVEKTQASAKAAAKKKRRQKKKQKAKNRKRANKEKNKTALDASNLEGKDSQVVQKQKSVSLAGKVQDASPDSGGGKTKDQELHKPSQEKVAADENSTTLRDVDKQKGNDKGELDGVSEEDIKLLPLERATTEDMDANDKLVSFLSQTGSILELAKMLDGEDDMYAGSV